MNTSTPQEPDEFGGAVLHENPWFRVRQKGDYFLIDPATRHVMILPVVGNHSVVVVRVRRPTLGGAVWELPSGGVDPQEDPVTAAARELAEETGIQVDDLGRFHPLKRLIVSPRFTRNPLIYQVDLSPEEYAARGAFDHEIESVHCLTNDTVRQLLLTGELYVSLSAAVVSRHLLSLAPATP